MSKDFEIIAHTADIKIRAYGASLQELFKNAMVGMFTMTVPVAKECIYKNERLVCNALPIEQKVTVQSIDLSSLLVDFLSYVLYLSDTHNQIYLDAKFDYLSQTQLSATVYGVTVTGFAQSEIKAVTYHDLIIEHNDGLWQADIVFDI